MRQDREHKEDKILHNPTLSKKYAKYRHDLTDLSESSTVLEGY